MTIPFAKDYENTIKLNGSNAFKSLKDLDFIPSRVTPFKIYQHGSGTYAVVFKAKDANKKTLAIRCFITNFSENEYRQNAISTYLNSFKADWKVDIKYLRDEIIVDNSPYPVAVMDWIDGIPLNVFITKNLNNNTTLTELQKQLIEISKDLEERRIGHGDLQPGNILIQEENNTFQVKLIDYDGMYIPEFKDKRNLENGKQEFQHPKRTPIFFNEKIDRFSIWVMLTALEGLKHEKSLWGSPLDNGFNNQDNLLFSESDFKYPNNSKLINRLSALKKDDLDFYLNKLKEAINSNLYEISKPILAQQFKVIPEVIVPVIEKPIPNPEEIIGPITEKYIRLTSNQKDVELWINRNGWLLLGTLPHKVKKSENMPNIYKVVYGNDEKTLFLNSESQASINVKFENTKPIENNPVITAPTAAPTQIPAAGTKKSRKVFNYFIYTGVIILSIFLFRELFNKKENLDIVEAEKTEEPMLAPTIAAEDDYRPKEIYPYGEGKGRIAVWTNSKNENIKLYVNSRFVGNIPNNPKKMLNVQCNSNITLPIDFKSGRYYYKAVGDNYNWEGYLEFKNDQCSTYQLEVQEPKLEAKVDLPTNVEPKDNLLIKANNGDAQAQFDLAMEYYTIKRKDYNNENAFNWFLKAAEQKHSEAQYYVGLIYDARGNKVKANLWYGRAAGHGNQKAIDKL